MAKYLGIKFKDGEYKKYMWDKIDFMLTSGPPHMFTVRETESGELLYCTAFENIKYYERVEEE